MSVLNKSYVFWKIVVYALHLMLKDPGVVLWSSQMRDVWQHSEIIRCLRIMCNLLFLLSLLSHSNKTFPVLRILMLQHELINS